MKLSQLTEFSQITSHCHDNPEADASAAGFGLFCFFKEAGVEVSLVYAGRNRIGKTNLCMMIEKLKIPITYLEDTETPIRGLLLMVDCQYGGGNVTRLSAEHVAEIDHHTSNTVETVETELSEIHPSLGSCATLVWQMLLEEDFDFMGQSRLGTAFYYGLFNDTNQFAEIYNPLDMEMRDRIPCDKQLITQFRNSTLSLKELETAGIALIRQNYNSEGHFTVIHAEPCDPNLLGLISDFVLQVDEIHSCVVYSEQPDGYKFSVRSCVSQISAAKMAEYLAVGIGSGGGHVEKAGGFLSRSKYEKTIGDISTEKYFKDKIMNFLSEGTGHP